MDINELYSYLDFSTIELKPAATSFPIHQAVLTESSLSLAALRQGTACFIPASLFNGVPEAAMTGSAFFVWTDEALKPLSSHVAVALCKERGTWLHAFTIVTTELVELKEKEQALLDMTQLISQNVSLKRLCHEAAKILGHPTSILDNSLSFLAYSNDFPEYASGRTENQTGMIPEAGIEAMKRQGLTTLHGALRNTDHATFFDYKYEGNTFTNNIALIRNGTTPIGSISCFTEDGPLRPSRLSLLARIAQLLSVEMQKGDVYTLNKSMHYAQLFASLKTNGLALTRDVLQQRLALLGYHLKEFLNIVYIDFSNDYLSTYQAESLAERTKPFIRNSIYTIEQTSVVFLTSTNHLSPVGDCDLAGLKEALTGLFVKVGISNGFARPEFSSAYLDEAKRAISVGSRLDPTAKIYPFDRYRLYDLLDNIKDPKLLYSYRLPPLLRLIEQDLKNDSHLTWTLYCHLQDPAHPDAVAKRLFVHKNTLYYRLDKIRETLGRDFKDAETIANIKLTFDVLRLQGRFDTLVRRDAQDGGRE